MKPRVLIISRDSWNNTNNNGNTLSNLFQNWETDSIANLYCRDEIPDNTVCTHYFKISESDLVNKLLGKKKVAGEIIYKKIDDDSSLHTNFNLKKENTELKLYDFFRNNRWHMFLWGRELLWKLAEWKSNELIKFLKDFDPQIIYSQSYDSFYMHTILHYVQKNTNAKVVYFHCDDLVTYRQYSLSPFYWINRFLLRKRMNKSIKAADKNYCIIGEQAKIYKAIYNKKFELLYKTGNFKELPIEQKASVPLKLVYTGNINYGRINSILSIVTALQKINKYELKAKLYLYTANLIPPKVRLKLESSKAVEIMGKVSYNKIPKILANSDVLIHVESFEKQQMLATSLSFSTKLVDYFEAAKPILAIGWEKSASIKYLKENEIGITVNSTDEIYKAIYKLLNNPDSSTLLGIKAREFGLLNHNKNVVLQKFENDLERMICKSNIKEKEKKGY